MERLVNKRVRLQNRLTNTFLVACSDKESVTHVSLDSNKPKPENSVWVIKSKKPEESVRLESVYGKVLSQSQSNVLTICQVDKKADKCRSWWTFEDVDSSGFTRVMIKFRRFSDQGFYIHAKPGDPEVMMCRVKIPWWFSWAGPERIFHWDLEIVETPPPTPTLALTPTPTPTLKSASSEGQTGREPTVIDGIPTAGCIYQVQQMTVRNIYRKSEGTPANFLPYGSYDVNTGRNTNGSGTQIVGGVTIQTRIDHLVNKNIVRRDT